MRDQTKRKATSVEINPQIAAMIPADNDKTAQTNERRDDLALVSAYASNVERYFPQAGSSSSDRRNESGSQFIPGSNGFVSSLASTDQESNSSFAAIAAILSCAVVCIVLSLVLFAAGYRIPGLVAVAAGSILSTVAALLCVMKSFRIAKKAKEDEKRFRRIQAEIRAEIERISGGSK